MILAFKSRNAYLKSFAQPIGIEPRQRKPYQSCIAAIMDHSCFVARLPGPDTLSFSVILFDLIRHDDPNPYIGVL